MGEVNNSSEIIVTTKRFAKTAATVTMKVDGQKRLEQKHPFRKIYMEYGVAFKSCLVVMHYQGIKKIS